MGYPEVAVARAVDDVDTIAAEAIGCGVLLPLPPVVHAQAATRRKPETSQGVTGHGACRLLLHHLRGAAARIVEAELWKLLRVHRRAKRHGYAAPLSTHGLRFKGDRAPESWGSLYGLCEGGSVEQFAEG